VNDEDSLKSRVMVMVMVVVRITIGIANPNHDPAGCGLTLTLTAQRYGGYSFRNSPRHEAKVGYCPVYHFEKQNN